MKTLQCVHQNLKNIYHVNVKACFRFRLIYPGGLLCVHKPQQLLTPLPDLTSNDLDDTVDAINFLSLKLTITGDRKSVV